MNDDFSKPPPMDTWHVLSSADLLALMRRCHAGEDPDLVLVEEYANARTLGDGDPPPA